MPSEIPSGKVFFEAVRLLQQMPRRYQFYAAYAAEFWSRERVEEAARNGDVPGRPGELTPEGMSVQ